MKIQICTVFQNQQIMSSKGKVVQVMFPNWWAEKGGEK